ncbi:MAG: hypothetical protein AB4042_01400 [Leptolyngbyaceae cyanobacterium]
MGNRSAIAPLPSANNDRPFFTQLRRDRPLHWPNAIAPSSNHPKRSLPFTRQGRSPLPPHNTRLPRFLQPTTIAPFIGQTRSPLFLQSTAERSLRLVQ